MPQEAFINADRTQTHLVLEFSSGRTYCGQMAVGYGQTLHPTNAEKWPAPPAPYCGACMARFNGES
jgi:hypothetical protein